MKKHEFGLALLFTLCFTTLLFIFYPNPSSGDLLAPYPEQVFQCVSAVYLGVSTLLIALNLRRV